MSPVCDLWFEVAVNDFCDGEHGQRVQQLLEEHAKQTPAQTAITILLQQLIQIDRQLHKTKKRKKNKQEKKKSSTNPQTTQSIDESTCMCIRHHFPCRFFPAASLCRAVCMDQFEDQT